MHCLRENTTEPPPAPKGTGHVCQHDRTATRHNTTVQQHSRTAVQTVYYQQAVSMGSLVIGHDGDSALAALLQFGLCCRPQVTPSDSSDQGVCPLHMTYAWEMGQKRQQQQRQAHMSNVAYGTAFSRANTACWDGCKKHGSSSSSRLQPRQGLMLCHCMHSRPRQVEHCEAASRAPSCDAA
jgi:hypothetical protein